MRSTFSNMFDCVEGLIVEQKIKKEYKKLSIKEELKPIAKSL